jgi:sugar lactone lactonase YvrE
MNLENIMKDMIENNTIYRINDYKLCIVYSHKLNCFLWCDESGKAIEDLNDSFKYKRVILSPKLIGKYTKIN